MSSIITSASKIAFLMLVVSACIGFFIGKLDAPTFEKLASMAFVFYFSNKGDSSQPFAGK